MLLHFRTLACLTPRLTHGQSTWKRERVDGQEGQFEPRCGSRQSDDVTVQTGNTVNGVPRACCSFVVFLSLNCTPLLSKKRQIYNRLKINALVVPIS